MNTRQGREKHFHFLRHLFVAYINIEEQHLKPLAGANAAPETAEKQRRSQLQRSEIQATKHGQ